MPFATLIRFSLGSALGLCLLGLPVTSRAASFTVNSTADASDASPGDGACLTGGGVCTLRAAVEEATALAGADTISVPAGTIVLSAPLVVDTGGLPAPLSIAGAGPGTTILDGNSAVRVLDLRTKTGPHTLSGLTVRNASTAGNGGGVYNETTLTVSNARFEGNQARQGGAIYNLTAGTGYTPELHLTDVTFHGNSSTTTVFGEGGGALFNGSVLSATRVTFTSNASQQGGAFYNNSYQSTVMTDFTMSNNTADYGGGVDNDLGTLTLRRGVLSGNEAQWGGGAATGGGGIYHNEGTLILEDLELNGNRATSDGGYGGGLYSYEDATLTRVSFVGNEAAYGAGLYLGNFDATPGTVTLTNVTVSGNVGTSSTSPVIDAVGGGLYVTSNCQVTLTNSTVTGNSAVVAGGIELLAAATGSSVTLRNTILAGNVASAFSPECRGSLASGGHNVVQSVSGCGLTSSPGDQIGVDPKLLPAIGERAYHPFRLDSPALDAGSAVFCPPTDARGLARPQGGVCDVGAFERGDAPGLGDLDLDTMADVVWREPASGATYVWFMDGSAVDSSGFTSHQASTDWQILRVADFSGDGRGDVLWRHRETGATVIWTMLGTTASNVAYTSALADLSWHIVATADFDGSGTADILWREAASGLTYIWFMNGPTVSSSGFTTGSASPDWHVDAVGDFDLDGQADILWRQAATGATYLWIMQGVMVSGDSGFTSAQAGVDWSLEGAGDFGGDTRVDLLWRDRSTGSTVVWTMAGTTVSSVDFTTSSASLDWEPVGVADMTGEGKADILWRESLAGATYLWVMDGPVVSAGTGFTGGQADNSWQARHPR